MIEFINIDSGTSTITEQFFLVCHSKVMKQCHGVIRKVVKVSGTEINKLKNEMYQMVVSDIEIHKESINTDDAVTLFHDLGMTDKEKLFRYRRSSRVNIYVDFCPRYFHNFLCIILPLHKFTIISLSDGIFYTHRYIPFSPEIIEQMETEP